MALLMEELNRRGVTALAVAVGTGAIVKAGGGFIHAAAAGTESGKRGQDHNNDNQGGEDVSATEDLMREHGVLRRTQTVSSPHPTFSVQLPLVQAVPIT